MKFLKVLILLILISQIRYTTAESGEYYINILSTSSKSIVLDNVFKTSGEVNIASIMETNDAINGSTGDLVYLLYPELSSSIIFYSTALAYVESADSDLFIGNIIRYTKIYENNGGELIPVPNWSIGESLGGECTTDRVIEESNYLDDVLNFSSLPQFSSCYGNDASDHYSNFENGVLTSGFYPPSKILNKYNEGKLLFSVIYLDRGAFDQTKEYVMQVETLIFGTIFNGDPNKHLIDRSNTHIQLRFRNFDQSNNASFSPPLSSDVYKPQNSVTYLGLITLPIAYVLIIYIWFGRKSSKKEEETNEYIPGIQIQTNTNKFGVIIKKIATFAIGVYLFNLGRRYL